MNLVLEQFGDDGAFVDIEQGDVVVGDLVQQDDELDEVRVGLLPERFLAFAEEIVQQRRDVVRERVGVEVVVQRVVAVVGVQADLDVVVPRVRAARGFLSLCGRSRPSLRAPSPPMRLSDRQPRRR